MTIQIDQHLAQLVLSLQAGAMQQMGKTINPATGKTDRDLEVAKYTIDIIDMLEKKMHGNLTDDEARFISAILTDLRLNFVDEAEKKG
jgi:Domain of unknown function (DUF1844)